jgi:ribonucleotide reductase alpha subunit
MQIEKRNKRKVLFNPNKLINRLKGYEAETDLTKYIHRAVIDCQNFFYDGISTREIDQRLAQCVAQLSIFEPEMDLLGGYIIISAITKDVELLNYNYTDNAVLKADFIEKYNSFKRPEIKLPRMSYFAASTLEKEFLLRNEKGEIVETPYDYYWRIAVNSAKNEKEAISFYDELINRKFSPSNPIAVNSGTNKGRLISCTTMSITDDSKDGILEIMKSASDHSANNSGLGIYIGDTRSKHTLRSKGGKAAGIRSLAKTIIPLSQFFRQSETRRGAFALYCDIWHRDIIDFIPMKRQDIHYSITDQNGFYGICIPDLFYKRFAKDEEWSIFCPEEVRRHYGFQLSDFHGAEFEEKYIQIENDNIIPIEKVSSSELMQQMVDAMASSGVPYIFNRDNANKDYQQGHIGVLKSQQLCVTGDTQIMTEQGEIAIEKLAGSSVKAWNGVEFSETKFFKTGDNEKVLKITFSNGKELKVTPDHKFFIKNRNEVEAKDLVTGDNLEDFYIPENPIKQKIKVTNIENVDGTHKVYCGTEPKIHRLVFNGIQASNCNEFSGIHNEDFEAQCALSSVPLPYHIKEGKFDFKSLTKSVKLLTRFLNNIIDINEWNTLKAERAGTEHRNIGIGILGLADVFAMLDMVYGDEESRILNEKIQKTIYLAALEESCSIAEKTGLGTKETLVYRKPQEWIPSDLVERINKFGVMNHLLTCNMPTSTTSKLLDITSSFEVFDFPVAYRETVLGEFKQVNRYLVNDLKKLGMWNEDTAIDLVSKNDVRLLDVPQHIKDKYIDKYHHSNKVFIEMCADRQKYIDQGQSMNLYYDKPERSKISTALYYGWSLGLQSGSYYTTILKKDENDGNLIADKLKLTEKPKDSPFECFGCSA